MASPLAAGGLASGIDTTALVEQLAALERRPLTALRARQSAIRSQVSALGDLTSKLNALQTAAQALSRSGPLALQVSGQPTALTATPGSGAQPGRYTVEVDTLASAAKLRSQAFTSGDAPVRGGTLHLEADGVGYDVQVSDGATLSDVALLLNQSGAPVSASVLSDGQAAYLSLTRRSTGHQVGQPPESALTLTENSTGSAGQTLSASTVSLAQNAHVTVDGLAFERTGNELTDVIPGVKLSLKAAGGNAEELVVSADSGGTAEKFQGFLDAYNDVIRLIQKHLAVNESTRRESTLAGDGAVRGLQANLQRLTSGVLVPSAASVRTLADTGVKTARDGTLSLDTATLERVLTRDPAALERLFQQSTTGLVAATEALVQSQTQSQNGALSIRQAGLDKVLRGMEDEATRMELRVEQYRTTLIRQFTAMEKIVSGLKATGNFLTQQDALLTKGNS